MDGRGMLGRGRSSSMSEEPLLEPTATGLSPPFTLLCTGPGLRECSMDLPTGSYALGETITKITVVLYTACKHVV